MKNEESGEMFHQEFAFEREFVKLIMACFCGRLKLFSEMKLERQISNFLRGEPITLIAFYVLQPGLR